MSANQKKLAMRIAIVILFVVGLGMLAGGSIGLIHLDKVSKEYTETTATIEDIQEYKVRRSGKLRYEHDVIISYEANDSIYHTILGSYSASMSIGDKITISYNPEKPTETHQVGLEKIIWTILIVIGIILLVIGATLPLIAKKLPANVKVKVEIN